MLLIGQSAIPAGTQAEALLHAKTYTPQQACDAGIFHGLIENSEDIDAFLNDEVNALLSLNMNAYVATKKRLREKAAHEAFALLEDESLVT